MDVINQHPWITSAEQFYEKDSCLGSLVDKVATLELRESKHTKDESLRQLREWIKQNQDIENCITGR